MAMNPNDRGLWAVLVSFGLTIVGLAVALTIAYRSYSIRVHEQWLARKSRALGDLALVVPTTDSNLSDDPFAEEWRDAPRIEVPVKPQNLAMPALTRSSVTTVTLQARSDGREIAWRLSWRDAEPDRSVEAARFCDAAALQFPLTEGASFMMGGPGARVHILHWKALWQEDIASGFQDVQDLHPNYWTDLYWFANGTPPQRVPEDFADPRSHAWFPARAAGNPLAIWERSYPVEELVAEGFGTLTHDVESAAHGRGVWRDGAWSVVFVRPLRTMDSDDFQFHRGVPGKIGLAVWQGHDGNVGGRKHYSDWVTFEVLP